MPRTSMAASTAQRSDFCKTLAFALLLIASLLNGAMAQEAVVTERAPILGAVEARGDMIPKATNTSDAGNPQEQKELFPSVDNGNATVLPDNAGHADSSTVAPRGSTITVEAHRPKAPETPAPARGDGPADKKPVPRDDVVCVSKEAVQNKNTVSLKLKATSSCEATKKRIEGVLLWICGENCKLQLYQEDNTDEVLVAGPYVQKDVGGMANVFNQDDIKNKTDVEEAVPRWGKSSKLVLVSVLLAGLLLAALLVAGYYLKTHRKNSKGVRLAESFQVDEENQANTLVSVAPLPQEPLQKPILNGESPPDNGTSPSPTTNGHSANQTPVADTEM